MSSISKEYIINLLKSKSHYDFTITSLKHIGNKIVIIADVSHVNSPNIMIDSAKKIIANEIHNHEIEIVATAPKRIRSSLQTKAKLSGVNKLVLISSCKGGVGKSTITALLAAKLAKRYKVGVLDADIYGPSIHTIFDLHNEKQQVVNNQFLPHIRSNIQVMSIGSLVDVKKATIWRGPMVTKTLNQLLVSTKWQNLDFLLIDTPPGTGDVLLTLAEKFAISAVVLVSTAQELAAKEILKSINMYETMQIPILGLVENMSYLIDSYGKRIEIFSGSYLKHLIDEKQIEQLASLPLVSNMQGLFDTIKRYEFDDNKILEHFELLHKI